MAHVRLSPEAKLRTAMIDKKPRCHRVCRWIFRPSCKDAAGTEEAGTKAGEAGQETGPRETGVTGDVICAPKCRGNGGRTTHVFCILIS